MRSDELIDAIRKYDKHADIDGLRRACVFAEKMHYDQRRDSGEKYIIHPFAVAEILVSYKMDSQTIIAALLHDTVEDTPASYESVRALFGKEVANLVQGLTKLESFQLQSSVSGQAENFQKLILASSKDVRILIIKMADRLHNMRTLENCTPEKRKRKAQETMDIYVPLAERLGLHKIQIELEDLSFKEINPTAYANIQKRLNDMQTKNKINIQSVMNDLRQMLSAAKIKGRVLGRVKMPYSLWRKLQKHSNEMSSIFDILGFRIVVKNISDCYRVLGLVHQKYRAIPGRFKDYISTPKDSGYQSLQTSVIAPKGWPLEIQIRTEDMEEEAMYGIAAHWSYKQGVKFDGKKLPWMRDFLALMDQSKDPSEFLRRVQLHLYTDKLFCFAADGTLYSLTQGATALDFACVLGSKIALKCVGATINGEEVPLTQRLKDGDKVIFKLSGKIVADKDWLKIVTTPQAQALLESYFKETYQHKESWLKRWLQRRSSKRTEILGLNPGDKYVIDSACNPKPGDAIVAIRESKTITIHKRSCAKLKGYASTPNKWIPVEWHILEKKKNNLNVDLRIVWKTKPESMSKVIAVLGGAHAEIQQLTTLKQEHKKTNVIANIRVKNTDHLLDVLDALRECDVVESVFQKEDE